MKRLAAQYILLPDNRLLKQHYIELQNNQLTGVFPLHKEIANTVFYNSILVINTCPNEEIELTLLERIDLLPPKFGANDCRRHRHIQRLGRFSAGREIRNT